MKNLKKLLIIVIMIFNKDKLLILVKFIKKKFKEEVYK